MASWREGWCGSAVTVDIILRWGRRDRETPLGTYSDVLPLQAWNRRLSPIGLRQELGASLYSLSLLPVTPCSMFPFSRPVAFF